MEQTSIIIATLNRPHDLQRALASIAANTAEPLEVLIVDQGDTQATARIVQASGLTMARIITCTFKSLTRARNKGWAKAKGAYVLFIDDDVALAKDYLANAERYMQTNQAVQGICGMDVLAHNKQTAFITTLLATCGQISSLTNESVVLASGQNVYRFTGAIERSTQWLSGCNMFLRTQLFNENFTFNEGFVRWCFGEDVMLTYQIYKKYGQGSLQYLPSLALHHYQSPHARLVQPALIKMKVIYRYIFWKNEIHNENFLRTISYVVSQITLTLYTVFRSHHPIKVTTLFLQTYMYLYKYRKLVCTGDIDYNAFILKDT